MYRIIARILFWLIPPVWLSAQPFDTLRLSDLSAFQPTAANWQVAGSATADINKDNVLKTGKGAGVLVNLPTDKARGNIQTNLGHGDMDLDLEFMMARHSNSGIYLQGRYEIQLLDSWGKRAITYGDCGGIYERWDDSKPQGKQGYEGTAPLLNASRAPGLWQRLEISFRAPRFDARGVKLENARILSIRLNGVIIHRNVDLTGPTRGGMTPEAPRGPLFIQGDHGPVAFRNIRYRMYDQQPLRVAEWRWAEYDFQGQGFPEAEQLSKPVAQGVTDKLSPEMVRRDAQFALKLTGKANFPAAGTYRFNLFAPGLSRLKIDGKPVTPASWWEGSGEVALTTGPHELELVYYKPDPWYPSGLDLSVAGPGLRVHSLSATGSVPTGGMAGPIYVDNGNEPVVLRSFMDFQNPGKPPHRVTHAISVGFPQDVSYSYDLKNGALFQVWRGGFLEATPMWNDRGDGSSQPHGSTLPLIDAPVIAKLASASAPWPDSVAIYENFRPLGYRLDERGSPVYRFTSYGSEVEDRIAAANEGRQLSRTVSLKGGGESGLYLRIAAGSRIELLSEGLYMVDQQYYIQLPAKASFKSQVRDLGGKQELLAELQAGGQVQYDIIW